jgi:hypothetical protein
MRLDIKCDLCHNLTDMDITSFRMKTVSMHQPHYHPWLGLLHKIASSDLHVVLDDVQFRRRNFHNRAQYSAQGSSKYLTLPVNNKGLQTSNLKINEIKITSQRDLEKNFKTLQHCYGKTAGWELIEADLKRLYETGNDSLFDLNFQLLELMTKHYQIDTPLTLSSSYNIESSRNQRLIDICIKTDSDTYLSGNGAKKYMDVPLFQDHNISVDYQRFEHPQYNQPHGPSFNQGCLALEWLCIDPVSARNWLSGNSLNKNSEISDSGVITLAS